MQIKQKKAKILFFDIENAPHTGMFWDGLYEQNILSVTEYGYMISFSYKWAGESSVRAFSLADFKGSRQARELQLLKKLHAILSEAHIVIAHNGDSFDIKKANAYFIRAGLPPVPQYRTIDTLKMAKKFFKFNSNRLDDLGDYLGLGRKIHTGGFTLWKACMELNKEALAKMVKYNKQDVILLEKVYVKLRPWMTNHPDINNLGEKAIPLCPKCGSDHLQKRGFYVSASGKKHRLQCQDCAGWSLSELIKELIK